MDFSTITYFKDRLKEKFQGTKISLAHPLTPLYFNSEADLTDLFEQISEYLDKIKPTKDEPVGYVKTFHVVPYTSPTDSHNDAALRIVVAFRDHPDLSPNNVIELGHDTNCNISSRLKKSPVDTNWILYCTAVLQLIYLKNQTIDPKDLALLTEIEDTLLDN